METSLKLYILCLSTLLYSCSPSSSEPNPTYPNTRQEMAAPTFSSIKKRAEAAQAENPMYTPMRNLALKIDKGTVKSMLQGGKSTVYGIILERNIKGVYETTVGLSDGTASFYRSIGPSAIGGAGDVSAATNAMFMVGKVNQDLFKDCPINKEITLPQLDEVSIIVLSTKGRFNCRFNYTELGNSGWADVYNHAGRVKNAMYKATF